jgi:hypothetical protein
VSGDFTDAELHAISAMTSASRTLPEDFLSVPAVQELACLFVKIEPLLTDQQKATVIACGAMLVHYGKAETMAGIQAAMALMKARPTPGDPQ